MTILPVEVPDGLFQGAVVTNDQPGYDQARAVWNGLIDRHPRAIIRCAGPDDVRAGVQFAHEHDLPIAVRGGGHSVAGHGTVDDGIVLDLRDLDAVDAESGGHTVRAGGGATWGAVDAITQRDERAVPGGVFSRTGIAGLTLGGGYGWIRNSFGLSARSLRDAELVTADGRILASVADEEPDLLWALRGGGGNFGVVTAFTFDTHPVPARGYFLFVVHDAESGRAAAGLRLFRDFCAVAPPSVSMLAFLGRVPAGAEGYEPDAVGRQFIGFGGLFLGDADEGRELLRPLHEFGTPLLDVTGEMAYTDVQKVFDEDYPDGARYYWKSTNVRALTDEAIDTLAAAAIAAPSELSTIDIWHTMGAAAEPFDGAFLPSPAPYLVNPEANWIAPGDDAANIGWARGLVAALAPLSDGSRYLNFAGFNEDGDAEMSASFRCNLTRLEEVKRRWDPENLFHLNQNVKP
ncbi:FAD-binding oxidoreductase [Microbacterium aerolatum]|uniref:FAD-binding oxidoreductase n=1 Tax=Microbacterium aerolatum TaxID=153731 RepID=UPI00384A58AA